MKRPVVVLGTLLLGAMIFDYIKTKIANFEIVDLVHRNQKLVERQQKIVNDYYLALNSCRLTLDMEMDRSRAQVVASARVGLAYKKAIQGDRRSWEYLSTLGIIAPRPGEPFFNQRRPASAGPKETVEAFLAVGER